MIASLDTHECFVSLPEPKIRIAKITMPLAKNTSNNEQGFVMRKYGAEKTENSGSCITDSDIEITAEEDNNRHSFDIPLKDLSFKKSSVQPLSRKSAPKSKKQVVKKRDRKVEPEISLNIK